jgi:hypothetical protein
LWCTGECGEIPALIGSAAKKRRLEQKFIEMIGAVPVKSDDAKSGRLILPPSFIQS